MIVVYTTSSEVLLIERVQPLGFWQSVTGSMEWDESDPKQTAYRELDEELGWQCPAGLVDCEVQWHFPIKPQWQAKFPPGTTQNLEHVFRLCLPVRIPIHLCPNEHRAYQWLGRGAALEQVSSYTNRDAIARWVP